MYLMFDISWALLSAKSRDGEKEREIIKKTSLHDVIYRIWNVDCVYHPLYEAWPYQNFFAETYCIRVYIHVVLMNVCDFALTESLCRENPPRQHLRFILLLFYFSLLLIRFLNRTNEFSDHHKGGLILNRSKHTHTQKKTLSQWIETMNERGKKDEE